MRFCLLLILALLSLFSYGQGFSYPIIQSKGKAIDDFVPPGWTILDNTDMDDPYQELAIGKGILEISFHLFAYSGTWYVTSTAYKFRYQQGQFILIGADHNSFHRGTGDYENYSYNFLTKKRILTTGNNSSDKRKSITKNISVPILKTLKTFSEPFTWEVEEDIYL